MFVQHATVRDIKFFFYRCDDVNWWKRSLSSIDVLQPLTKILHSFKIAIIIPCLKYDSWITLHAAWDIKTTDKSSLYFIVVVCHKLKIFWSSQTKTKFWGLFFTYLPACLPDQHSINTCPTKVSNFIRRT